MSRTRAGAVLAFAAVFVVMLVGCTPEKPPPADAVRPDVLATGSCMVAPTPTGPPSTGAAPVATPPASIGEPSSRRQLPGLALPCLDGPGSVQLRNLRGPVLINVWASWCPPCREELPAFQRYAQRAGGQVKVIGVDTADTRPAANSVVEDFGLTFPNLYDRDSQLQKAMGGRPLPVTVFVDANGAVVHVYNGKALDDAALDQLVRQHFGVEVAG